MERLSNIELHPVISFSPVNFSDYSYPFNNGNPSKGELYDFWKKTLNKHGFGNLEPIEKGFDYVKINQIDKISLEFLTKTHAAYIPEPCDSNDEDPIEGYLRPSLEGGVVLTSNNKIIIPPQCCVSLQDYKEWSNIKKSETFQRLWIGHPWIYYKSKGNDILLTRLIEKGFDDIWRYYELFEDNTLTSFIHHIEKSEAEKIEDTDVKFYLDQRELKTAILKMEKEIESFKKDIENILIKLKYKDSAKMADCFVNGSYLWKSY